MRRVYFFLLTIIFLPILLNAYDWPIKEDTVQHVIISTLGEWRNPHFHAGVDINAPCSTKVYTIEGDTCYIDRVNGYGSGINIGHFRYLHMAIPPWIGDTSFIAADSFFAKTDSNNHVHLQEADRRLTAPGASANNAKWLNPLRSGAMTPYVDSTKPHIDSIKFYRQGPGDTLLIGILDRKVDVLSVAGDARTDSTGHSAGGNCSVYRIGYEVRDTLGNVVKPLWEKIKFDTIPSPPNASQLLLTYGSGSTMSHFRYWVSNDPFNPDSTLRNWYWNTKQKTGQPDSVDADSIEVAKFKDGYYWVKVIAADIRNNADTESVKVHVDNFNPRVVHTYPDNWYRWIARDEKEVWGIFSEAMDTATLNTTNIKIRSLVDTTQYYTIKKITYIDSLYKLILEVDSFKFHDEVQVWLSDSIKDLAGKTLEPGGGKSPASYTWKFTVGVIKLTDNDIMDIRPDIYGDNIAWVEVLSGSTGNIKLHDLTSHNTLMLNTTVGIHNWPIVWKGQVAWREELSAGESCSHL